MTSEPLTPTQAVFERVLARPVAASAVQHGRLVHVMWVAPAQGDRLVQLYVDGQWAGVSASSAHREAWLVLDSHHPHVIELLAVDVRDGVTPMHQHLAGMHPAIAPAGSATVMRDLALPVDARVSAAVDASSPVKTALFAADSPRGGFGAVFGEGGFGYDTSIGPGLGRGALGYGPLGSDGDALRWRDAALHDGSHTLELSLQDAAGQLLSPALTLDFTIARPPAPPADVTLTPDLQLTWT